MSPIIINEVLYVIASKINSTHFFYNCPCCYEKYNKDGSPRKNGRHLVHQHGSNDNLYDRIEHRSSHCKNPLYKNVNITINGQTEREFKPSERELRVEKMMKNLKHEYLANELHKIINDYYYN